eukprot:gene29585-36660_t
MRAARSTASRNLAACGRPVSLFLTSHEYMNKTSNFLALLCALALPTGQAGAAAPIPHLVQKDGRHALIVDGKPYTMLAVQAHNSSNYPAALPEVWAGVRDAQANTLEIPVAWEQVEPIEGKYDFSYVDTLVAQARRNKVRLVLLWFGTWKNTSPQYTPAWVKFNNARFPRMLDKDGKTIYCLSPHGEETLRADQRAFVAFMAHLKKIDQEQRTVIMVQVQNEVGTYGTVKGMLPRDIVATGAEIILGNTFHLWLRPGTEVIKKHGDLHDFMKWQGPILTDSGGFQVFSLGAMRKIKEEGVTFASPVDGSKVFMGPEESMQVQ